MGSETPLGKNQILYIFFWVFPRRQCIICRRFGTMYQFHLQRLEVDSLLPAFEDGTDTWFRNVGILYIDAGEIPKRKYTIFKSRRKLEIYKNQIVHRLRGGRTGNLGWILGKDTVFHFLLSILSDSWVYPFSIHSVPGVI